MTKYIKQSYFMVLLAITLLFTACASNTNSSQSESQKPTVCEEHADADNNNLCDNCGLSVLVYIDFYSVNDLHGKIVDNDSQPGVDELTTYIKKQRSRDDYVVLISAGDMWQGSAESNLTRGKLTTEWMNEIGFVSMTIGNHEYDWGGNYIEENAQLAEFPFLAINIYDKATNEQVEYCQSSIMVEAGELQVGIIGAIGDCYSSIASDKVSDVYFKVGNELTELVKAESEKLKNQGADCIVYVLHDGYGQSEDNDAIESSELASYYDVALSNGYVDVVFESHTHQSYVLKDEYGVYHLQNGGDNSNGISHVELAVNSVNGNVNTSLARTVSNSSYENLASDPIVETLLNKYADEIQPGYEVLGTNSYERKSNYLKQLVANMYIEAGVQKWGEEYDIVLGGGYISVRSPYNLAAGDVNYAQLQTLLPFDNELVLCSVKGSDLLSKFINSSNSNYYIAYSEYGRTVKNDIDPNATYYIITDTYSSLYGPNHLTEIERYAGDVYARDLIAEYIKNGGLE